MSGMILVSPASQPAILKYLSFFCSKGKRTETLHIHVAAISFFSQVQGFRDPCRTFLIRRALRGWDRAQPRDPDYRRPVTFNILSAMLQQLWEVC